MIIWPDILDLQILALPSKDMQTLPQLSFDPIFMEDAQCAETNEKSIFRFLFFKLCWEIHRKLGCMTSQK